MLRMWFEYIQMLQKHDAAVLFKPQFFEQRPSAAINAALVAVKPVAQYPEGSIELGFNVGVRGNGVDAPVWPKDLSVEIVRE